MGINFARLHKTQITDVFMIPGYPLRIAFFYTSVGNNTWQVVGKMDNASNPENFPLEEGISIYAITIFNAIEIKPSSIEEMIGKYRNSVAVIFKRYSEAVEVKI